MAEFVNVKYTTRIPSHMAIYCPLGKKAFTPKVVIVKSVEVGKEIPFKEFDKLLNCEVVSTYESAAVQIAIKIHKTYGGYVAVTVGEDDFSATCVKSG